jgi:hypothetical protein
LVCPDLAADQSPKLKNLHITQIHITAKTIYNTAQQLYTHKYLLPHVLTGGLKRPAGAEYSCRAPLSLYDVEGFQNRKVVLCDFSVKSKSVHLIVVVFLCIPHCLESVWTPKAQSPFTPSC